MTDTIEARRQRAAAASLFQQRPTWLIDAGQGREVTDPYRYAPPCYRGSHATDVHVTWADIVGTVAVFTGLTRTVLPDIIARVPVFTGLTGIVLLVDVDYPTGSPTVLWRSPTTTSGAHWAEATSEPLGERAWQDSRPMPSASARLRVERLAAIQAALALPIQALADVLDISRPGLYKWLDASKDIKLQETNRQRLASAERLAKLWRQRSNAPLSAVIYEPLARGRTALQMLTDEHLDEAAIIGAFDELVDKLQAKPKSLGRRMTEAGFTRRKSRRSLPEDE
jgi:hypothetical protein